MPTIKRPICNNLHCEGEKLNNSKFCIVCYRFPNLQIQLKKNQEFEIVEISNYGSFELKLVKRNKFYIDKNTWTIEWNWKKNKKK